MTDQTTHASDPALLAALAADDASTRLRAAMAAGSNPHPGYAEELIRRCGVEPDFFVRDMLTWALTRLPADLTVPGLVTELGSASPQARAQALHTLSKIGDRSAWPSITVALLHDELLACEAVHDRHDGRVGEVATGEAVEDLADGEAEVGVGGPQDVHDRLLEVTEGHVLGHGGLLPW